LKIISKKKKAFENRKNKKQEEKNYPLLTTLCLGHTFYGTFVRFHNVLWYLLVICSHLIWQATM